MLEDKCQDDLAEPIKPDKLNTLKLCYAYGTPILLDSDQTHQKTWRILHKTFLSAKYLFPPNQSLAWYHPDSLVQCLCTIQTPYIKKPYHHLDLTTRPIAIVLQRCQNMGYKSLFERLSSNDFVPIPTTNGLLPYFEILNVETKNPITKNIQNNFCIPETMPINILQPK